MLRELAWAVRGHLCVKYRAAALAGVSWCTKNHAPEGKTDDGGELGVWFARHRRRRGRRSHRTEIRHLRKLILIPCQAAAYGVYRELRLEASGIGSPELPHKSDVSISSPPSTSSSLTVPQAPEAALSVVAVILPDIVPCGRFSARIGEPCGESPAPPAPPIGASTGLDYIGEGWDLSGMGCHNCMNVSIKYSADIARWL